MIKLDSEFSSLNYELSVWKKENNYKIGGTVIEKYVKFSMQLNYTKRSICDPKEFWSQRWSEVRRSSPNNPTRRVSTTWKKNARSLPIRYFRVTADRVKCLLGFPIHTTWDSLLAKFSTSSQHYPQSGFTYSVSKQARQLMLLETLVLKVSAVTLLMYKSREILT